TAVGTSTLSRRTACGVQHIARNVVPRLHLCMDIGIMKPVICLCVINADSDTIISGMDRN
ncbi:MAG: hypothetical protein NTV22_07750, partial [bacterium]|nr:hypothetical protein [bacterium]